MVPAAHYVCGVLDLKGRTTLQAARHRRGHHGLHGESARPTRLEGLVWPPGRRTARGIAANHPRALRCQVGDPAARSSDEGVIVKQNWDEIRQLMWNYVGIVRTDKRLARAGAGLDNLVGEIQEYYWGYLVDRDLLELRNLAGGAADRLRPGRKESRDAHASWPAQAPRDTVLVRGTRPPHGRAEDRRLLGVVASRPAPDPPPAAPRAPSSRQRNSVFPRPSGGSCAVKRSTPAARTRVDCG